MKIDFGASLYLKCYKYGLTILTFLAPYLCLYLIQMRKIYLVSRKSDTEDEEVQLQSVEKQTDCS